MTNELKKQLKDILENNKGNLYDFIANNCVLPSEASE